MLRYGILKKKKDNDYNEYNKEKKKPNTVCKKKIVRTDFVNHLGKVAVGISHKVFEWFEDNKKKREK
jgi:hypothetical protein